MIFKASAHKGSGLAAHLLNGEDNERVRVLPSRGLVADDVAAAISQFAAETAGTRARAGMIHVSASPDPAAAMDAEAWARVWRAYEAEFGLQGTAYAEVEHTKHSRVHRHRVYQRIDPEHGRAVHLSQSYARQEYVARTLEHALGHAPTRGRHHRAVLARLEREQPAAAVWLDRELEAGPTPEAVANHREHQQQIRTGVDHVAVAEAAAAAWRSSDTAAALEASLAEHGLALAAGEKTVQLVDAAGGTHDLRRTLRAGGERVRARELRARIDQGRLPSVATVRAAQAERAHEIMNSGAEHGRESERGDDIQRGRPAPRPGDQELGDTALGLCVLSERGLATLEPDAERDAGAAAARESLLPEPARVDRPAPGRVQRLEPDRAPGRLTTDQEPQHLLAPEHLDRLEQIGARSDHLRRTVEIGERRARELDDELRRVRSEAERLNPERRIAAHAGWREMADELEWAEDAHAAARSRRDDDLARTERWGVLRFMTPAHWRGRGNARALEEAQRELRQAEGERDELHDALTDRFAPHYVPVRDELRRLDWEREDLARELPQQRRELDELRAEAHMMGADFRRATGAPEPAAPRPEPERVPQRITPVVRPQEHVRERTRERSYGYEPGGP